MDYAIQVLVGVLLALVFIGIARGIKRERLIFGLSLLVAGFWYAGYGLFANFTIDVLTVQIVGGLLFIAAALLGLKYSILFIGVGWMSHGAWDLISPFISDVSYMPAWTEPVCLGYDLLVGIYLVLRWRGWFDLRDPFGEPVVI